MEILFIWIMFGLLAGYIASQKGRNGFAWAMIGLLGGIFAVIAICVVPSRPSE